MVFDVAGANVVHPAVEMQHLLVAPRVLHNSGLGEVENLLLNIPFHKSIPSLLLIFDSVELGGVVAIDVFDLSDPVVNDSDRTAMHSGLHASTAIMTADNNVTYFKRIDCKIKATEQI